MRIGFVGRGHYTQYMANYLVRKGLDLVIVEPDENAVLP